METAAPSQKVIVIEFSLPIIRAGFAGESAPRVSIPLDSMPVVGANQLLAPFINNLTTDELREICLHLLSSIFLDYLQVKSKDTYVLIVEPIVGIQRFREAICLNIYLYRNYHSNQD